MRNVLNDQINFQKVVFDVDSKSYDNVLFDSKQYLNMKVKCLKCEYMQPIKEDNIMFINEKTIYVDCEKCKSTNFFTSKDLTYNKLHQLNKYILGK